MAQNHSRTRNVGCAQTIKKKQTESVINVVVVGYTFVSFLYFFYGISRRCRMERANGWGRAGAQKSSIPILELIYIYLYMSSIRKWPTIWMLCIREIQRASVYVMCHARIIPYRHRIHIYSLLCNTFIVVIGIGFYCYSYYCRSKLGGNGSKWNNRIKEIK